MEAVDEENGQRMDEGELRGQVFVFMLAGHETVSVSTSWTLYFLAQYPEIQDKVRREIKEKLRDSELICDTFEAMEYLAAVMNESLRMRPPVTVFRRFVAKEDNILGYKIPQGSSVMSPLYSLHHLSKYWKDAEKFNPDRFLTPG